MNNQSRGISRLLYGAFVVGVGLCACTHQQGTVPEARGLVEFLESQPDSNYSEVCEQMRETDRSEVEKGRYIDPHFTVMKWRGHAPAPGNTTQSQDGLLQVFKKGELKLAFVVARGGMGKSSLARSMAGRACGYMPVFKLDANEDVLPTLGSLKPGANAIMNKVRDLAALPNDPDAHRRFDELLKTNSWLLLVDSLDELGLKQRPRVLRQMQEVLEQYSNGLHLIIFARPPVFASAYELAGVDSMLKIQDLTCGRIEERVNVVSGNTDGVNRFWDFAAQIGISRKILEDNRCFYPQMSTYRDINVAFSVALGADLNTANLGKSPHQPSTRSALYGHFTDQLMSFTARETGLTHAVIGDIVKEMVRGARPNASTRDVSFDVDACVRVLATKVDGDAAPNCKKILDSKLFKRMGDMERWRFTNQSVMDYFLAQWMDEALVVDQHLNCDTVTEMWRLFESNEVAGFLAGMKNGVQCLPQVFMQLCINGANFDDTLALMDQGLPAGRARADLLTGVRGKSSEQLSNRCFRALVDGLDLSGPITKAP